MSNMLICECAMFWPGEGHHPECPVRRALESAAERERKTAVAAFNAGAAAAHHDTVESVYTEDLANEPDAALEWFAEYKEVNDEQ